MSVNQGNKISLVCSITAVGDSVTYQWFYSDTFPTSKSVWSILANAFSYSDCNCKLNVFIL